MAATEHGLAGCGTESEANPWGDIGIVHVLERPLIDALAMLTCINKLRIDRIAVLIEVRNLIELAHRRRAQLIAQSKIQR